MRTTLGTVGAMTLALALVRPALANHDQGNGQSQDHLHRRNPGAVSVVTTAEPLALAAVGIWFLTLGLLRRRK